MCRNNFILKEVRKGFTKTFAGGRVSLFVAMRSVSSLHLKKNSNSRGEVGRVGVIKGKPIFKQYILYCRVNRKVQKQNKNQCDQDITEHKRSRFNP